MFVCMCTCVYMYIYIYIHMYICIHTYDTYTASARTFLRLPSPLRFFVVNAADKSEERATFLPGRL